MNQSVVTNPADLVTILQFYLFFPGLLSAIIAHYYSRFLDNLSTKSAIVQAEERINRLFFGAVLKLCIWISFFVLLWFGLNGIHNGTDNHISQWGYITITYYFLIFTYLIYGTFLIIVINKPR